MLDRRRSERDRRSAPRKDFVAAVRHRVGMRDSLALSYDLGAEGMKLRRSGGQLRPRAVVDLAFELPDGGELLEVRGYVTFERDEGGYRTLGVRFTGIDERARARLKRFVGASHR